jgi:hypothetical protein
MGAQAQLIDVDTVATRGSEQAIALYIGGDQPQLAVSIRGASGFAVATGYSSTDQIFGLLIENQVEGALVEVADARFVSPRSGISTHDDTGTIRIRNVHATGGESGLENRNSTFGLYPGPLEVLSSVLEGTNAVNLAGGAFTVKVAGGQLRGGIGGTTSGLTCAYVSNEMFAPLQANCAP